MDALQQPQRFMRPMNDPQQQQRPPQWYSGNQFQYQTSPNLPPHHHLQQQPQWDHNHHYPAAPMPPPPPPPAPYPTSHNPIPPPYPVHPSHHQYPPPRPPIPHMNPPPQHQNPPYPQPNQSWGNPSWPHHQGWDYPDRNIARNEEDWAARARAWAAAKAATETQHAQPQFAPADRTEEQSHVYDDHYQQAVDPRITDTQQSSLPLSSHQQFPVSVAVSHRPPGDRLQESASFISGPSSFYVSDGHVSYSARDGAFTADTNPPPPPPPPPLPPPQGSGFASSSVYQQEVPSSYSSIPGNEESGNRNEQSHMSLQLPLSASQEGGYHSQPNLPAIGRSISVERTHLMHGDLSVEPMNNASDQSSDYDHGSVHDDSLQVTNYTLPDSAPPLGGVSHYAAVPPVNAWTATGSPGVGLPPVPSVPSAPQFESPFVTPSLPGHPAPIFGRMPGHSFPPSIPPVTAPFGLGAGTALHPTTSFPDTSGTFNVTERPKKASVPNWLREEIIKKKSIISSSSVPEQTKEDSSHSLEDVGADKSFKIGDQADSRSIDSTRSTDDEDDDEDDVEAARAAAINQEIKRVLTEVLLQVTDELFEEIATKVVSEDDLMVEVDNSMVTANHKASPSPPTVPTPKASAKVLIPVKAKDTEVHDVADKSASSSPGDVLGLANYASDDEDEVQSSSLLTSGEKDAPGDQHSGDDRILQHMLNAARNGASQADTEEPSRVQRSNDNNEAGRSEAPENESSRYNATGNITGKESPLAGNKLNYDNAGHSATRKGSSIIPEDQITFEGGKKVELSQGALPAFESEDTGGKSHMVPELAGPVVMTEKVTTYESESRESRSISEKNDRYGGKRSAVSKDSVELRDSAKVKIDRKHFDSGESRRVDSDIRREKAEERNSLKERVKDQDIKSAEKIKESDLRRGQPNMKDEKKEVEKVRRMDGKEEKGSRTREREKDEKEDRSRHRSTRESKRHRRHHSPSVSRGKSSRDLSLGSKASDSTDEDSENPRSRKVQSSRRSLSPSPVRSRRRQVSRSPHSKHCQRRHSPHSSHEIRRRRSRSVSPSRRRR